MLVDGGASLINSGMILDDEPFRTIDFPNKDLGDKPSQNDIHISILSSTSSLS